jgi:hypothetical protein
MTVTKRRRARSWDVFERRFRPIVRADNTPLWELSEVRPDEAVNYRCRWTLVDGAGGLYLAAGFRFVNRLCYVRCEVPWTDADTRAAYRYD